MGIYLLLFQRHGVPYAGDNVLSAQAENLQQLHRGAGFAEGVVHAHPDHRHRHGLADHLGHRAAQAPVDAVLLRDRWA